MPTRNQRLLKGTTMWTLVIVMLGAIIGNDKVTVLEKYETYEECREAQATVSVGMVKAYPGDTSFIIECRWKPPQV